MSNTKSLPAEGPPPDASVALLRAGVRNSLLLDRAVQIALMTAATTSVVVVALIFLYLGREALPFAKDPGLGSLWGSRWVPVSFVEEAYGIFPLVTGSLLVTFIATAIAAPFGILGAVYVSEIAGEKERDFLKPFVEILAGIPSVVIGFFGLVVLAPFIKSIFGLPSGLTALTGALLLALMAIPTIMSIAEDALRSVPASYRQASLALGATPLETVWKVTLPAALPGVTAAVLLGVGRVVGETMALLMVTGNAALITLSPVNSVRTITATIAAEMGEVAYGSTHYRALFCIGLILLLATFVLNLMAQRAMRKAIRA